MELNEKNNNEKKVCKKCGHEVCPHCGDWCDVILYSENDKGNHVEAEELDDNGQIWGYPAACCGGECEY